MSDRMSAPSLRVNRNETRSSLEERIVESIAVDYGCEQWNESHRAGALYGQAMQMSMSACLTTVDSHSGGYDFQSQWTMTDVVVLIG